LGDAEGQGRKKTKRVITRNIGVPLRSEGAKILVADFDVDKVHLKPDHEKRLDDLIAYIKLPGTDTSIIGLEGRASDTGPHKNNLWLSIERARAIQRYFRRRQIIVKDSQIAPLGDKYPLPDEATGIIPKPGEENPQNRSVMIYLKHPPVAVAHVYPRDTVFYSLRDNAPDLEAVEPKKITLDGTKSIACPGFPIVSYLWEQIESGSLYGTQDSQPKPDDQVFLNPRHSSVKADEVDWKITTRSDHAVVSFATNIVDLLQRMELRLNFRLTVTDVNQLSSSTIVKITIKRLSGRGVHQYGPKLYMWGLKMLGSVSLTVLGRGKSAYMKGGIKARGKFGVGGNVALGMLKKNADKNPPHVICFFGLGGGIAIGAGRGKNELFDGLTMPTKTQSVFAIEKVKEILDFLDIDIDAPWEDYNFFSCTCTDYAQFDNVPALIAAAGASLYFIGSNIGVLDFLTIDTNPERIDVGGVNFINPETTIGVEAQANVGAVKVFTADGFVEFLDSLGWKT